MSVKTIDLHGIRGDEVIDIIDRFMFEANKKKISKVRIICGKGTGVVKKNVISYLKMAHYPWHYEKLNNGKLNEGVLLVEL